MIYNIALLLAGVALILGGEETLLSSILISTSIAFQIITAITTNQEYFEIKEDEDDG